MNEQEQQVLKAVYEVLSKKADVSESFQNAQSEEEMLEAIQTFMNAFEELEKAYESLSEQDDNIQKIEKSEELWNNLFNF